MTLGKKIKLLLELNGKTQRDLANFFKISEGKVSRWCNDKVIPNYEEHYLLHTYLHCSLDELLGCSKVFEELLSRYEEGLIK